MKTEIECGHQHLDSPEHKGLFPQTRLCQKPHGDDNMQIGKPFRLWDNFVTKYRRKKAPFGFNGLGELVYNRTYSRLKADGKNEQWWETVQRVVEGTFNMQKRHIDLSLIHI